MKVFAHPGVSVNLQHTYLSCCGKTYLGGGRYQSYDWAAPALPNFLEFTPWYLPQSSLGNGSAIDNLM